MYFFLQIFHVNCKKIKCFTVLQFVLQNLGAEFKIRPKTIKLKDCQFTRKRGKYLTAYFRLIFKTLLKTIKLQKMGEN